MLILCANQSRSRFQNYISSLLNDYLSKIFLYLSTPVKRSAAAKINWEQINEEIKAVMYS